MDFLSIGVLIVCRFVVIVGDVCIFSEAPLLVLKAGLRNMDPISEQCVLKKVSRLNLLLIAWFSFDTLDIVGYLQSCPNSFGFFFVTRFVQ